MESFTITYELTEKEIFIGYMRNYLRSCVSPQSIVMVVVMLIYIAIYLCIVDSFTWHNCLMSTLTIFATSAVIILISALQYKKLAKQTKQDTGILGGTMYRTISEDGLTAFFMGIPYLFKWEDMRTYHVSKDYYFIRVRAHGEIILPKSAFKSEAEMAFLDKCLLRTNKVNISTGG